MAYLKIVLTLCFALCEIHAYHQLQLLAYYPKGLKACLRQKDNVTGFTFYANVNKYLKQREIGEINGDVIKSVDRQWCFAEKTTKLRPDDVLYYRFKIKFETGDIFESDIREKALKSMDFLDDYYTENIYLSFVKPVAVEKPILSTTEQPDVLKNLDDVLKYLEILKIHVDDFEKSLNKTIDENIPVDGESVTPKSDIDVRLDEDPTYTTTELNIVEFEVENVEKDDNETMLNTTVIEIQPNITEVIYVNNETSSCSLDEMSKNIEEEVAKRLKKIREDMNSLEMEKFSLKEQLRESNVFSENLALLYEKLDVNHTNKLILWNRTPAGNEREFLKELMEGVLGMSQGFYEITWYEWHENYLVFEMAEYSQKLSVLVRSVEKLANSKFEIIDYPKEFNIPNN